MKPMPIRSANPTNKLPTPKVTTLHATQPMDLKPRGNTVAVTAKAENPFTQGRPISVRTQASGGVAKAPAHMQSRRLMHSFIPGIGEDPNAQNQGAPAAEESRSWWEGLISAGEDAASVYAERERRKAAEAEARAEAARARAAGDTARAQEAQARLDMLLSGKSGVNMPLLLGGLALLGVAGYMMMQNKKAGRPITGRRPTKKRTASRKRKATARRRRR